MDERQSFRSILHHPAFTTALHRLIALSALLGGLFGLHFGELLLGLHVAGLIPECGQP
jgi:hypothetical protein